MPRSTRAAKSTAPSPAPLRSMADEQAQATLERAEEVAQQELATAPSSAKGKERATDADADHEEERQPEAGPSKLSAEERLAKMKQLRQRMNQSTQANRKELIEDHQKQKTTAKELARLEKQRKLAAVLREKIDAEESGLDVERKKNWDYTIEDNDRWEAKLAAKREKSEYEFDDTDSKAQRKYWKDTEAMKVDLDLYNKQKEEALGLEPGTLSGGGQRKAIEDAKSQAVVRAQHELGMGSSLPASSTLYGQHKPSDDAIDRVIGKMNADNARSLKADKKRARRDEGGDVTYINEKNKVFNKKINRYFDKYTSEIRANFERGTAL